MTEEVHGGVVDEDYSTPDIDDIFQEEDQAYNVPATPVCVEGIVRTDEMPCRIGAIRNILLPAGTRAIKLVQANPRRKRLTIWVVINIDTELTKVCIATGESAANAFEGALIESGGNAICRNQLETTDEIWGRPAAITDTSGLLTTIIPSTMDTYVSLYEEYWAR